MAAFVAMNKQARGRPRLKLSDKMKRSPELMADFLRLVDRYRTKISSDALLLQPEASAEDRPWRHSLE
jgi:hypothetical protein